VFEKVKVPLCATAELAGTTAADELSGTGGFTSVALEAGVDVAEEGALEATLDATLAGTISLEERPTGGFCC
jgi:hypothetical protein